MTDLSGVKSTNRREYVIAHISSPTVMLAAHAPMDRAIGVVCGRSPLAFDEVLRPIDCG
jgi:hypothetical protein